MTALNGSSLKEASSAVRAPGSSPVRSRCMPRSARMRAFCRIERDRAAGERHGLVIAVVAARPSPPRRGSTSPNFGAMASTRATSASKSALRSST